MTNKINWDTPLISTTRMTEEISKLMEIADDTNNTDENRQYARVAGMALCWVLLNVDDPSVVSPSDSILTPIKNLNTIFPKVDNNEKPDIVTLLRNASESDIRQRLAELDGEREALKTLLRSVLARRRASSLHKSHERDAK